MITPATKQNMPHPLLLTLIVLFIQALHTSTIAVQAHGIGYEHLIERGTLLSDEFAEASTDVDFLFWRKAPRIHEQDDYDKFVDIIKEWKIDVVAPGRRLINLMNTCSTRVFAKQLISMEDNFRLDLVSRPMLKAYLAVISADHDEIQEWVSMRSVKHVGESCSALLHKRDEAFREVFGEQNIMEEHKMLDFVRDLKQQDQLHLAHLTFKNNLNLFMLETYLILCNRVDSVKQTQDSFDSYESLF